MIVPDASAVIAALTEPSGRGPRARAEMAVSELRAPALVDLEVVSALRRLLRGRELDGAKADEALHEFASLSITRASHGPLLPRIWELRDNLTAYDAAYVALAEALQAPLLTADRGLAEASGIDCETVLLS